ncbi:bifunctional diguanylate cyclase/phosphohydrolase [Alicyclobacillus sp. ALC3]|uniref:bifunctional diguanylate cyclase/phosphohydrolase n=1 Tax=Alicyclobacillus sp. ALC3 TaxID=2796143 RepID=UPI00237877D2|nr:HD domain-containing phosphohydrolase [Alicyclobacillus sp. ALC3]WDL98709.1 diguanylate cyclase [Alicyclobacillus sp. ALC3]
MNGFTFALSVIAAHYAASLLVLRPIDNVLPQVVTVLLFAVVYFGVNVLSLWGHLFFVFDGRGSLATIREGITLRSVIVYAIEILIGLLLSLALRNAGLAGALLFTGLLLLAAYSYRDYFQMAKHFRELSIRDELTGLYNHRWIQTFMDELVGQKQPFALLMLDIDHFRRYNDAWGHVRGDDALKEIAQVLDERRIADEEVARYSGEEFAIALRGYSLEQAQVHAENVRRAVEDAKIDGVEMLPGKRLTVSIGVAHFPSMAENKTDLLMMVDDALYKGKFSGRNKVSIYTSVLDEMKRNLALTDDDEELFRTIKVFLTFLNTKDRYTYAHTERDVRYVESLAVRVGIGEEDLRYLRFGAFLHDIGKVEIPIEVLTKRGPLSKTEWDIMKSHVELGVNIVKPIAALAPSLPIIRHHHERFGGGGYPDGIAGEDIPLSARILTIADSFDAMTTSRPYQRKRSMEEAFAELRDCAGTQFDPDLVEPFIDMVREIGLLDAEEGDDSKGNDHITG